MNGRKRLFVANRLNVKLPPLFQGERLRPAIRAARQMEVRPRREATKNEEPPNFAVHRRLRIRRLDP